MVMWRDVERCRALSSVVESNLIMVKIVELRCSTFLLFEVLSSVVECCRVLLSVVECVWPGALDSAELTHVHLIIFPTTLSEGLCQARILRNSAI